MRAISPTIHVGQAGVAVSNLQDVLHFFLEREATLFFGQVGTTSQEDLKAIREQLAAEATARRFGNATQVLTLAFQRHQGLGDSLMGVVETSTANRLNDLLNQFGVLESIEVPYRVSGTVRDEFTRTPASSVQVRVFDQDFGTLAPLGDCRTGSDGTYVIEFHDSDFRRTFAERGGPDLIVKVFDAQGMEIGRSKRIGNAGTDTRIDVEVNMASNRVHGRVADGTGQPVADAFVKAFDRDLRRLQLLGQAQTDAEGDFTIDYERPAFALADAPARAAPWLIVEVQLDDAGPAPAARAEFPKADRVQRVDLVVNRPVSASRSEWQRISEAVLPLLRGQGQPVPETLGSPPRAADLLPTELTTADLDFIAQDADLARPTLEAWAAAHRLQAEALQGLQPLGDAQTAPLVAHGGLHFYAHCRSHTDTSLNSVLAAGREGWQREQRAAERAGWVPVVDAAGWKALENALATLADLRQLDVASAPNDPFAQMLAAAPVALPPAVALEALAAYRAQGLSAASLAPLALKFPAEAATVQRLARFAVLHNLTAGDLDLARVLDASLGAADQSTERLADMDRADWLEVVRRARPTTDDASSDTLLAQALALQARVEARHPVAALHQRLQAGSLRFTAPALADFAAQVAGRPEAAAAALSGQPQPQGSAAIRASEPLPQAVAETLMNLQRFARLGVSYEVAADLMNSGITSPASAQSAGDAVLASVLGDKAPAALMQQFTARADHLVQGAMGLVSELVGAPWRVPMLQSDTRGLDALSGLNTLRQALPTLRGLLGDLDECACRPCESVLGLPAYLVDLLQLLRKVPNQGRSSEGALALLSERRPDILHLELSCENAEAELPHIDLALEVLENAAGLPYTFEVTPELRQTRAVANEYRLEPSVREALLATTSTVGPEVWARSAGPAPGEPPEATLVFANDGTRRWVLVSESPSSTRYKVLAVSALHSTPGGALMAAPEHRNVLAYRKLRAQHFPWSLPFDLAGAETALFLNKLGQDRAALMALHAKTHAHHAAAESLDLSVAQAGDETSDWDLLSHDHADGAWWLDWGFDSNAAAEMRDPASGEEGVTGTPLELLSRVSVLLSRAGIDLETLQLALQSQFITAYGTVSITGRDQCKTSQMRLIGLEPPVLDRLHRLLRLARKMVGWSLPEVDSALWAVNENGVDALQLTEVELTRLAELTRLQRRLDLPPAHVLALRMRLLDVLTAPRVPGQPARPLFEAIFTPPAAPSSQRAWFELNGMELKGATAPMPAQALEAAAAAMGARVGNLRRLIGVASAPSGYAVNDEWSLAALADLLRRHTLGRALGLTPHQVALVVVITGINPFPYPHQERLPPHSFERFTAFCDAVDLIRDSGLTIEETASMLLPNEWLIGPLGVDTAAFRHPAELIDERLAALQAALRAVPAPKAGQASPEQEARPALESALGASLSAQLLAALRTSANGMPVKLTDEFVDALCGPADSPAAPARPLGAVLPLATRAELAQWLTPVPTRSLTSVATTEMGLKLAPVVARLAERQREQSLVNLVSDWTGWHQPLAAAMLQKHLRVEVGADAFEAAALFLADWFWSADAEPLSAKMRKAWNEWNRRLDRLVLLGQRTGLHEGAWALFEQIAVPGGATDPIRFGVRWHEVLAPEVLPETPGLPAAVRWSHWAATMTMVRLLSDDQWSQATMATHLQRVAALPDNGSLPLDALRPLAERLSWSNEFVLAVAQRVNTEAADSVGSVLRPSLKPLALRVPDVLKRLLDAARRLKALGATPVHWDTLVNAADNEAASRVARQLLSTQVGPKGWTAALQPISDKLRKAQRDALVAYLVHRERMTGADELYERWLIDPQMQPCMRTTRLGQAIASTQLLVQRILFGLEPTVAAADDSPLRRWWTWMRNYRVWEANRKIFLYPENWLLPELRDDKSSSFKQLESELAQGELSADVAAEVFGRFLNDVEKLGQMQVLGSFEDVQPPGVPRAGQRMLYVVGRTVSPPYAYYWRRCDDFGGSTMEWSGWQRIEVDIQGDHVMPFVLSRQLHVAWPIITKKATATEPTSGPKPTEREVKIGLAGFDGRRWSKVATSRDGVTFTDTADRDDRLGFTFRVSVDANGNGNGGASESFARVKMYVAKSREAQPPAEGLQEVGSVPMTGAFPDRPRLAEVFRLENRDRLNGNLVSVRSRPLNADPALSAAQTLTWSCWIKVKAKAGSALGSWMPIVGDGARRVELIGRIRTSSKPAFTVPSGKLRAYWEVYGFDPNAEQKTFGYVPEISWAARISLEGPDGTPYQYERDLGANPSGRTFRVEHPNHATRHLVIHFDASGKTPEELGLDYEAVLDYKEHATFLIETNSDVIGVRTSGPDLPAPAGTSSWLNGFQEKAHDGNLNKVELPSPTQTGQGKLSVFQGAGARYSVVPTSSDEEGTPSPASWHFTEGGASAFVDLLVPGRNQAEKVRVFPSAFPESTTYRVTWQNHQTLPEGNAALSLFGADRLPLPSKAVETDTYAYDLDGNGDPVALNRSAQARLAFDSRPPNASYNWEVFFHGPLLIAERFTKQHRFEDAERWLRYVFDPTAAGDASDSKRFLRSPALRNIDASKTVTLALTLLARAAAEPGQPPSWEVTSLQGLIERWRTEPFRPFVIARQRHVAFLWKAILAYLDNLMAWADSLYRRDTRESVAEAAQLYVLAARLLGPRPKSGTAKGQGRPLTFADHQANWDEFGNIWMGSTSESVHEALTFPLPLPIPTPIPVPVQSSYLLFCIPANDRLQTYWNTLEARLFNLRHCRNLDGITRDLPITDAPIDPELLAQAVAAGLDIADVIGGIGAPFMPSRYHVLAARAADLASEARALGSAMLAAIEKRDAESLSLLRSTNEVALLRAASGVRDSQVEESEDNLAALRASRESVGAKYLQFQRLLGRKGAAVPPENQSSSEESMLGNPDSGLASERSELGLLAEEDQQYIGSEGANTWAVAAGIAKALSGALHTATPLNKDVFGPLGHASSAVGDALSIGSLAWKAHADRQGMRAGHLRRRDDWAFQSNQTLKELQYIDKQILAARTRNAIATKERDNNSKQIEQAQAVDEVLRSKFSNVELYDWMVSQLSIVHHDAYRLALDLARRAERSAALELGSGPLKIIRNDHWDSLRSGLMAGDRLVQDLKRLEIHHLEQNRREHEMAKHVSLRLLNPRALVDLLAGDARQCEFEMPEWLFDMDVPGHYLRRLKAVGLSIPCVVGPYASVNCKLTLLRSEIRHSNQLGDSTNSRNKYEKIDEDPRFDVRYGATESIVTSSGRDDSGLFETNLRDERYLPFEYAGTVSRWRLELTQGAAQFDPGTITDVILHIRYTARDGGELLASAARHSLAELGSGESSGASALPVASVSCRTDFSTEWAKAKADPMSHLVVRIAAHHLPYWMRATGRTKTTSVTMLALGGTASGQAVVASETQVSVEEDGSLDLGTLAVGTVDVLLIFSPVQ